MMRALRLVEAPKEPISLTYAKRYVNRNFGKYDLDDAFEAAAYEYMLNPEETIILRDYIISKYPNYKNQIETKYKRMQMQEKSTLQEKASIDWNNYLKPEEVKAFLSKDDKVESAEDIIYADEFKDRAKELRKSGWNKRDLAYNLANFYDKGHLTESINRIENVVNGKIYRAGDGYWVADLKPEYTTSYGTNYIRAKSKEEVVQELNSCIVRDDDSSLTEGIELTAFVKTPEGKTMMLKDSDYPNKAMYAKDLRANEFRVISIQDKRDEYVIDNSNYGNMSQLKKDLLIYRKMYLDSKKEGKNLFEDRYLELKKLWDEAMKISL